MSGRLKIAIVAPSGLGESPLKPAGAVYERDELGALHILVERILTPRFSRQVQRELVFVAGQRVRSRRPRASDLGNPRLLARLLVWPNADRKPDLTVVIVEAGEWPATETEDRLSKAEAIVAAEAQSSVAPPRVMAVAVQSIDGWLLAEQPAREDKTPELVSPPAASEAIDQLAATVNASKESVRRQLAEAMDLDSVGRRSRSFKLFARALRGVRLLPS